ncbi:MAG: DnaJ domain-containing protein [Thaumarchaeota archaeon]|nr:DnaJ domain-containing protein [Nitrososphaerota archaeon]
METEAEEWKRIEERRRRIYEELWRSDEERVRRQRERDPNANRRREGYDYGNPFKVNVNEILRATQELGVRVDATATEVKAAYKKMAMAWHPDRPGGSAEKMKDINEAKEVLLRGA